MMSDEGAKRTSDVAMFISIHMKTTLEDAVNLQSDGARQFCPAEPHYHLGAEKRDKIRDEISAQSRHSKHLKEHIWKSQT